MGRDSENSSDFIDLEFACFEELRLLRRDTDGRVLHAFFQYGNFVCIAAAAEGGLPALPHTLRIFDRAGVFQHTARCSTVGEEFGSVLLAGDSHADGIPCHSDGAVADQTVKAESRYVEYIRGMKRYGELLVFDGFVRATVIGVIQMPTFISVHRHLVGHKRIQSNDFIFTVADDLRVSVPPEEKVRHEGFPEHERTHLRVRLIVEQAVERMVERHCLAAAVRVFVEVQRQSCHSLGEDADAGVNRSHLHGTAFCYRFSGGAATHVKGVTRADCAVGGLVSGFE